MSKQTTSKTIKTATVVRHNGAKVLVREVKPAFYPCGETAVFFSYLKGPFTEVRICERLSHFGK